MHVQSNKELIHRLHDGMWNYEKIMSLHEFMSEDFVFHGPNGHFTGLREFQDAMHNELEAVGDLAMSVDEIVAEGDMVAVRFSSSFSHHGMFMGAFPRGETVVVRSQAIHRMVNGKSVEMWHVYDRLALLRDLGGLQSLKEDDEAQIRDVIEHASGQADLYFASDAEIITPHGTVVRGTEAIAAWLSECSAEQWKLSDLKVDGAVGVAYVQGSYTLRTPAGAASPFRGKYLEIWRKQDGGWRAIRKALAGLVPVRESRVLGTE